MPIIHGPTLLVFQNEKKIRFLYFQEKEIVEVLWNPTWEPEELQNTCESFKQSRNKFESISPQQTYLSLHQMKT